MRSSIHTLYKLPVSLSYFYFKLHLFLLRMRIHVYCPGCQITASATVEENFGRVFFFTLERIAQPATTDKLTYTNLLSLSLTNPSFLGHRAFQRVFLCDCSSDGVTVSSVLILILVLSAHTLSLPLPGECFADKHSTCSSCF